MGRDSRGKSKAKTHSKALVVSSTESVAEPEMEESRHNVEQVLSNEEKLDDIIIQSKLYDPDPNEQMRKVLAAFNEQLQRRSFVIPSKFFGKRVARDRLRLVQCNNIPQLVGYSEKRMRVNLKIKFTPGYKISDVGTFSQKDPYYGAYGSYVVNVPPGKLAKAYIKSHKVPILLGEGPHVINDDNFSFDPRNGFEEINSEYIQHETIHILRVPRGRLARVWFGTTSKLLESRDTPYVFNTPLFKIETFQQGDHVYNFVKTEEELVVHGSLKRVMPRTGRVAIAYDYGNLRIIEPTKKEKAILIDDPNVYIQGFLDTNIQTLIFPSKSTVDKNKVEKNRNPYHVVFRTVDSLEIGAKLLVAYRISDPALTLSRLNQADIANHIEKTVIADMNAVIQRSNSSEFLKTTQTVAEAPLRTNGVDLAAPSAPQFFAHFQDEIRTKLVDDFIHYGIELVRLNLESLEVLDEKLSREMANNSLQTAAVETQKSLLESKFEIIRREAEQASEKSRIEAESESQSKRIKAQGELNSAELSAQALRVRAEAEAESKRSLQKVDQERAKLFQEYPELLERDRIMAQAEAMKGIKAFVVPPEQVTAFYQLGGGFFAGTENNSLKRSSSRRDKGKEAKNQRESESFMPGHP